jgi:hypothetical protein
VIKVKNDVSAFVRRDVDDSKIINLEKNTQKIVRVIAKSVVGQGCYCGIRKVPLIFRFEKADVGWMQIKGLVPNAGGILE